MRNYACKTYIFSIAETMSDNVHKVLKESCDQAFFKNLEKCLEFVIPKNISNILQFNYYNNAKSLSRLDQESLAEIEEVMRTDFKIEMIGEDECVKDYLGHFVKNQANFKFIGGQKKIIAEIVEYCGKIYNEPTKAISSEDLELENMLVYQSESINTIYQKCVNLIAVSFD